MDLKITRAIACDFVRIEAGGKFAILGAYPNDSVIVSPGIPVSFSYYIEISADTKTEKPVEIQVRDNVGVVLAKTSFNLSLDYKLSGPITWGPVTVATSIPGNLHCGLLIDGRWISALSIQLVAR